MNYSKIFFILLTIFSFYSCKKELDRPNNNNVSTSNYTFTEIDWVVSEARFYTENLDNGEKVFYDHFSFNQIQSILNPLSGANVPMDTILKNNTTWRFSQNKFILNTNKDYDIDFNTITNTVTVFGLENGSSKPLTIIKLDNVSITFKVNESYFSFNGFNYRGFTTITLVKSGEVCVNCQPNSYYGYVYQGSVTNNNNVNEIIGTKWVVTRFYDGFANSYPNDTLFFINNNKYTINGGTQYNYTLNNIFGNNMSEITLYNFYTIGGDYSGTIPSDFISNGVLNSVQFNDIFGVGTSKKVWMTRIQ